VRQHPALEQRAGLPQQQLCKLKALQYSLPDPLSLFLRGFWK
jgi:hypothetical protein